MNCSERLTYYEKQDYEEAVKWLRLAADQGNENAAQKLEEIQYQP